MQEISTLSETDRQHILTKAYADPVFFCRFFFPEKFYKPIPWVHRGILALLLQKTDFLIQYGDLDKIVSHFTWKKDPRDEKETPKPIFILERDSEGNVIRIDMQASPYILEILPRGFSKTTIAITAILYLIYYNEVNFPLFVSESDSHASMQTGNIKAEIESNERLSAFFGNIVPARSEAKKWTDSFFETTTGVTVASRGRGGQVRGLVKRQHRPDLIIFDDLEDSESVSTAEQRIKARKWFYGTLFPVIGRMNKKARIFGLGTLLHQEALLAYLANDPRWTTVIFGAIDHDGEPLWADNMNLADLEAEKESHALAGTLAEFYLEYMSTVRDVDSAKFRQSFFIHRPLHPQKDEILATALALDPAISDKVDADFCGFGVVSVLSSGVWAIREVFLQRGMSPREQINKFFELSAEYNCTHHGVESNAYQAALIHLLREEMFRRKRLFEIIPIRNQQKKTERVEGILQPRYASGYIIHTKRFGEYETQLLDWPKSKKDGPDAVAMAGSLLGQFSPVAGTAEHGRDLADDEYPPLNTIFKKDWRRH